jgi:hypothetical protein
MPRVLPDGMFCPRVHGAGGSDEVSSVFIILSCCASSTYVKRLRSSSLLAFLNSKVNMSRDIIFILQDYNEINVTTVI